MNQYDFIESGYKIFGLYGADSSGFCECGDKDCKAAYKHPRSSNWQHSPHWSDDQLETMEELGQFATGYGVLVDGLLVVDVDARNGGVESFKRLCKDIKVDLLGESGLAVSTGSGQGSMHLYFKHNGEALCQHKNEYPGLDFKSTGFVVGPGSLHKSGNYYDELHGSPEKISAPPSELIALLKKPNIYRAKTTLGVVDVDVKQATDVLSHIPPDADYDTWIRCGMAIHHTFNGDGLHIWDEWSAKGSKYPGFDQIQRHWHSFGKSQTPVQYGTLIHYAEQNGYQQPVMFEYEHNASSEPAIVDLKRPPGLVGEICEWINRTSRYKRENLAVSAALMAVGNIGGLRYIDGRDGMTANMFNFCIAGSSTGKEHIQQCFLECMRAAGMIDAVHGAIKSEQEIIRNLTRHQSAFYSIDELGIVLNKIINSKNASYLDGVIGLMMSAYSKADSFLPVSGDVKESLKAELKNELAACSKAIDENEDKTGAIQARANQITKALDNISNGIEAPFLSMIGYTTPVTFNKLVDFEVSTNGFLSRAMLFDEPETNPKPQKPSREPLPSNLAARLSVLYSMGDTGAFGGRIENYSDKIGIQTESDAESRLDEILQEFWQMAEDAKDYGLEAIPRRGYEICAKVSFILAMDEGLRTIEHVNWAYALAKSDADRKMRLAMSNVQEGADSIAIKIQDLLSNSETGETIGIITNRCRPHKKDDVIKVVNELVSRKLIIEVEDTHKRTKKRILRYTKK